MGSLLSKDSTEQQDISIAKNTPTRPMLTPNVRISDIDPRSPSANICRTPIEILGTPIKDDPAVHDTFNLNSPGVIDKVLLDPRSPAVEFIRTPIVIQEKKPAVLRNKNLDNVLFNDTPKQRKPRLLDSTPKNQTLQHLSKRKSFAGYLETNLDFVETNLDEVLLRKSLSNLSTKSDNTPIKSMVNRIDELCVGAEDNSVYNLAADDDGLLLSNANTNDTENIAQIQNIMDNIIDDVFKIEDIKIDIIPRIVATSPKPRKIIRSFDKKIKDLIYEEHQLEANSSNLDTMENATKIEFSDNILSDLGYINDFNLPEGFQNSKLSGNNIIRSGDNVNTETNLENGLSQVNEMKASKNRIAHVIKDKNLDKLFLKDAEDLGKIIKRVPLTDRNYTNKIRSIPKLRVHDKPRKAQYSVSKIPQFRGKRFAKVPQTQCENTPPPKNASVWDNEETLII